MDDRGAREDAGVRLSSSFLVLPFFFSSEACRAVMAPLPRWPRGVLTRSRESECRFSKRRFFFLGVRF
jgi:hypothetical protein